MHKICARFNVPLTFLLAEDADELSELPILGFASCGLAQGWFVEENHPRTALVHACFANSDCFGVLAKGDSMGPAGIESGDLCVIDSSKPVEPGKPVMVRADWFYKGKNTPTATIKILESESESAYFLKGWFPVRDGLPAASFIDERPKSAVTFIAPVVKVVKVRSEQGKQTDSESILYNKDVLALCFEALKPVFADLEAEKFTSILDCLYRKVLKSGEKDLSAVSEIVKLLTKK